MAVDSTRTAADLALDLAAALDVTDISRRLPERAALAVDADRCALYRLEDSELVIVATYDRQDMPSTNGLRVALTSETGFAAALERREVVPRSGPPLDKVPPELERALVDVEHSLIVPLDVAGDVEGFLVIMRRLDAPFDEPSIETVRGISNVAAVSLRNARLVEDATTARRAMAEFLDVVVHELRSPLTVAMGYTSMMREGIFGEPPQRWDQPLELVEQKLTEAQRLVEELLLSARIESGVNPVGREHIDLVELSRSAVERARPNAHLVDAVIETREPQGPVWASADPALVGRILDNLINNAITHAGRPASVTVTTSNEGAPIVSVADHGAGIRPDERDHIFQRFFRGRESTSGSGLGLYLSRQLAEATGGELDLDEGYAGPGARFVLRLAAAG